MIALFWCAIKIVWFVTKRFNGLYKKGVTYFSPFFKIPRASVSPSTVYFYLPLNCTRLWGVTSSNVTNLFAYLSSLLVCRFYRPRFERKRLTQVLMQNHGTIEIVKSFARIQQRNVKIKVKCKNF